ncbi:hypothetical protein [Rhodopseudomonas palustris]|nr:hypothetical protein [Rhodopseudomonas palustris]
MDAKDAKTYVENSRRGRSSLLIKRNSATSSGSESGLNIPT